MKGKKAEIIEHNSFYEGMVGTIIEEHPQTVLVQIYFLSDSHRVMFYKSQIELL